MQLAAKIVLPFLASLALAGCRSGADTVDTADFAVLSDLHLHDGAALGASGPDFESYVGRDRKLLAQSEEILDAALKDLQARPLDFVLIPGDLTKDGELVNHQLLAAKLAALEASRPDLHVYVVPGNHDIWNPGAVSYLSSPPTPVDQLSPAEFERTYAQFGYAEALYRDPASLSYVAEPGSGIWILAIDSCEYADNPSRGSSVTAGQLSPATQAWILERLGEATRRHKIVLAMMHHGVVEHFRGEAQLFPEYLLTGHPAAGKALADAGLRVVFTGHFHSQDVVAADYGSSTLVDVETGSLVTPPSPYRLAHLDLVRKTLDLRPGWVTSIPSHPDDFRAFSAQFLDAGLHGLVMDVLTHAPVGLDEATADSISPLVVRGLEANFAGDESPPPDVAAQILVLRASPDPLTRQLGDALHGVWTDPPPADNQVSIATLPAAPPGRPRRPSRRPRPGTPPRPRA